MDLIWQIQDDAQIQQKRSSQKDPKISAPWHTPLLAVVLTLRTIFNYLQGNLWLDLPLFLQPLSKTLTFNKLTI